MDTTIENSQYKSESGTSSAKVQLDLGSRIKQLRKKLRLTLQQASDRTGVSISTLSKIERNDLSPTVTTLQRIATGFHIDSASLLTTPDPVLRVAGRRSVTRWDESQAQPTGTCHNAWLCSDLTSKAMMPIMSTVDARKIDDYSEWARYDAEVFIHVIRGVVVVHSQIYEPVRLGKGDSMYYDASTPHLWLSEGKESAQLIWVYTTKLV